MWCHDEYINRGSCAMLCGGGCGLVGWLAGWFVGSWVAVSCGVCFGCSFPLLPVLGFVTLVIILPILLLLLLLYLLSYLIIKVFLSQPMSFLTFTLLILSPILLVGEGVSSCVGLSCLLNPNSCRIGGRQHRWGRIIRIQSVTLAFKLCRIFLLQQSVSNAGQLLPSRLWWWELSWPKEQREPSWEEGEKGCMPSRGIASVQSLVLCF